MTIPSSLQQAAARFSQWRASKTSGGERTPLSLRKKAVALTNQFSATQVSKVLGLSGSQLRCWREELHENGTDDAHSAPPQPFVSLPKAAAQTSCVRRIILSFDDGGTIELTGDISSRLALVITEAIWRENASGTTREVV